MSTENFVTMLLKGHLSIRRAPLIRTGNVSIKYATEVKYLGISMTKRMNFLMHIERVRVKLTKFVGSIRLGPQEKCRSHHI